MTVVYNEQPATVQVIDNETAIVRVNGGAFGPQGIQGETGPQGPAGGSVISGSGLPTSDIGNNGDVYIDIDTGYFYGPKSTTWPGTPFFYNYNQRSEFIQSSPSDTWTVNHSLSGKPSVTIVDSGGNIIIGDVQYVSNTQVVITFTAPFSGSAYLT